MSNDILWLQKVNSLFSLAQYYTRFLLQALYVKIFFQIHEYAIVEHYKNNKT